MERKAISSLPIEIDDISNIDELKQFVKDYEGKAGAKGIYLNKRHSTLKGIESQLDNPKEGLSGFIEIFFMYSPIENEDEDSVTAKLKIFAFDSNGKIVKDSTRQFLANIRNYLLFADLDIHAFVNKQNPSLRGKIDLAIESLNSDLIEFRELQMKKEMSL